MARIVMLHPSLTVRMDLKAMLAAAGHEVAACANVPDLQQQLRAAGADLLLLDPALLRGHEALLAEPGSAPRVLWLGAEDEQPFDIPGGVFCPLPYDSGELIGQVDRLLSAAAPGTPWLSKGGERFRPRILAVDDSPTYLQSLAGQLRADDYELMLAASGEAALELLAEERVDCVLLDLIMAGLSGEETCRRIRSAPGLRNLPVIMLTAREERQAMMESFAAGADDFVSKSSDLEVLKARLAAQLRRRQNEEELRRMREELHRRAIESAEAQANLKLAETRAALLQDLQRKNAELQKREEELRLAKGVADQANAAKDQFLAVLSHELRTPLTPVLAAVQLMQRQQVSAEDRRRLDVIRRNIELEARLIDDLLDLTRIVRGKIVLERRPLDLCTIIERVADICMPDIEARKLHFGIRAEHTPHPVNGDASRLQQVFWNLLKNSIKFTPDGGCVGIHSYRRADSVVVEVTDTGIGIEPEIMDRIFNAFEQGDGRVTRQFGGLGLGLAITQRLLEMHQGSIVVHSEGRDKGATFKVTLPLALHDAETAARSEPPAGRRSAAGRRILLVEDHGDTALMMQMLLEASGYEVQTAGDVRQALQAIRSASYDLLISDLGLPDQSGLELMKEVREQGHSIKGIALSGFGREDDVRKSRAAGFEIHLTKPVDADTLMAAVEKLF